MKSRVTSHRVFTSGNYQDPDLHQQKVQGMIERRQAIWAVSLVLIGGLAFVAVAIVMQFTN